MEPQSTAGARLVLVADDDAANRDLLGRRLRREGHNAMFACDGLEALEAVRKHPVDLVLLDAMMPRLDGLGVLRAIRGNETLKQLPVLMISADDDMSSVAVCIEAGADDYIPKPFHTVLFRARVNALLERKRLRDCELLQQKEIERQKSIAQALLRNILPDTVATELAERGAVEPAFLPDVTIGFTDFAGFTMSSEAMPAADLVEVLNGYFTAFDSITSRYGLEKLKTIGDSYMFAAGLPEASESHAVDAVLAAQEMVEFVRNQKPGDGRVSWQIRIGLHTGPVVAGVVGKSKFAYDVWGNTVNLASRMESSGAANRVNLSAATFERVREFFECERRGTVLTKDGRSLPMFFADRICGSAGEFRELYLRRFHAEPKMPSESREATCHA